MLTSLRGIVAASLITGCGLAATPALADSGISISGNAAIVSEYRFRGIDASGGDIAIQGGVDLGHSSGFYVGAWGSSIEGEIEGGEDLSASGGMTANLDGGMTVDLDITHYGHTELDIYGGWSGDITSGISADVGVIYYAYPNAVAGDYDYIEFYGSLGFGLGPVDATLGVAYAPSQDALSNTDNIYVYADLGTAIPGTPVSLSVHVGYVDGIQTFTTDGDAFDWSVGADFAVNENLSVGVAYIGAEGNIPSSDYDYTDDAVVATLSVSF